jgi:uncharacterized protein HemX
MRDDGLHAAPPDEGDRLMPFLIGLALKLGIGPRFAKFAVIASLVTALVVGLGVAKCAYDRSVIKKHEMEAELKQAKRERKADANLQQQIDRDDAAAQERRKEIDDATANIPDQKPSARQRARACLQLQREAKERRAPVPAC